MVLLLIVKAESGEPPLRHNIPHIVLAGLIVRSATQPRVSFSYPACGLCKSGRTLARLSRMQMNVPDLILSRRAGGDRVC